MVFSGVPLAASASSSWPPAGLLTGSNIGLHGPYLNTIKFSVVTDDSTLYQDLVSGIIQGPEWPFLAASFYSAAANSNLYTNTTTTFGFYGIGFNTLRPVMRDVHFRQAIQYLTDYGFIEGTVLSGIAGTAAPDIFPTGVYPALADPSAYAQYSLDLAAANAQLKLVHNDDPLFTWTNSSRSLSSYHWFYNGNPFAPNFKYRVDDPQRTGQAQSLIRQGLKVGLNFNAIPITRAGPIFHDAFLAVISAGVYNPNTGLNSAPVFNYTLTQNGQPDDWDMYTFGWGVSAYYTWAFSFFNSSQVGINNFVDYYNSSMDLYSNQLNYASDITSANAAGIKVNDIFAQQLPYVLGYYTASAFSVYLTGWYGYVYFPGQAQMQSGSAYYSFLNLRPNNANGVGGTYNYAEHLPFDPTGTDPLYSTNWQWQADIYSEVWDSPLAQDPTHSTTANSFVNWQLTGRNVQVPFTGSTGSGAGWYDYQAADTHSVQNIVSGTVVTLDFYKNITFFDHVPMTAYDYNYSLDLENVAGKYPDSATPTGYTMSGPSGLIASYINPSNPFEIKVYINSSSVWNLANLGILVFPQHVFRYFNPDTISGATAALDTASTFDAGSVACACFAAGASATTVPRFLHFLYNLEVGQGPFWLKSYSYSTGAGELDKNVNYYRAAWWAGAPSVNKGASFSFSVNIAENAYNPTSSTWNGIAAASTGSVAITNATGTVTLMQNGAVVGTPITLTGGTGGTYTASIPTSSLAPGTYETVVNASYHFVGLARTWWQAGGLIVTSGPPPTTSTSPTAPPSTSTHTVPPTTSTSTVPPTTSTAPPTSTTTTSSTDYTPYIYGGVAVVIILIIAVALARRRGAGGT